MKLTFVESEMIQSWKEPEYRPGPVTFLWTDKRPWLSVLCLKDSISQLIGYNIYFIK